MTGRKIIYYILAGFIIGTLLLVYIQYNSAKNISELINGNEKLLAEFNVSNQLKELEKDVLSVESNIRGTVSTKDTVHINRLQFQITEIESGLGQLQKIGDDDSSVKYIDELDFLVRKKLEFSNRILDSFHQRNKVAAENLIATQEGKRLTDSISLAIQKIDSTRKRLLAGVTRKLDDSGNKALNFSTVLIVLVLISAAGLFWYIINTIRSHVQLIQQLNISEKKAKEAAQVKENFMANMSHEIRTPMNAIVGFTGLLQQKNLDDDSKEYVDTIHQSGEKLLTIINDILDLSKIEAGMMRIETAPFSISTLVYSIEAMFKNKVNEKHLDFSIQIDPLLPDILDGDAMRLTQVLVNLVGNAVKFTQEGKIEIKLGNKERSGDTIYTSITVSDTGIGIRAEKIISVFDRFQQAEDAVTRKYGGTGLGLSIVKDLVTLQKGTVTVESEPGIGTSFHIVIPYKNGKVLTDNTPVIKDGGLVQRFSNTRILVVEDNEINQVLIQHLFNNWQVPFDLASNGAEAISLLRERSYELILLDIQMPVMDGYTTAIEIRQTLNLDTPVIAMTAHALSGEREKCMSYGMNEYISKPIREAQLQQLIHRYTKASLTASENAPVKTTGFQYIDLSYMKEVSGGNPDYEKTVTGQFIEVIPEELQAIKAAWQNNDIVSLRQLSHNMKTTISVMGLNQLLQHYLDTLEYTDLTENQFREIFVALDTTLSAALGEARGFYESF